MAIGLGVLRLSADDFWSMTLPEMAAAMRGINGVNMSTKPPGRDALLDMIARYPDDMTRSM